MDVKKTTTSTGFKLSVMTLAIMNVTAVVSLRGLPAEAVYGLSSAFYYLFAAIVFLIPTAMVAAELAAMFADKQGGVFRWVGEAYGARTGFLAIWLQWIESTIWYPTVLTFGAVSIAFIGMNDTHDALLASNKVFTLCMVLAIYWIATLIALKGLGWVGKISKWGGMIGTIIPAGLLIVLGIIYISTGGHNHMDMSQGFFPDLSKFNNLVLASSIFLFYAGMEMMGIHVMDVKNPSRNYPKAIIIGSLVTVLIFILGTFSLGLIIPAKDISLTQSLLVGFDNYFHYLHISWAGPIIAIALMFGVLAGVLTWVAGPSKGIFAVGKAGYLPPFFQKTNKNGVQKNILLIQGCVVTLLALLMGGCQEERFQSPVPSGTSLHSVEVKGGTAWVDFSGSYSQLSGMALTIADYCVALSLTQLEGVYAVRITVNGQELGFGGYLDIGLYDTMEDLFVNFIGAVTFSVIGYFYIKHLGKGKLAQAFIPTLSEDEDKEASLPEGDPGAPPESE